MSKKWFLMAGCMSLLCLCMPMPAQAQDSIDISSASCVLIDNGSGARLYEKDSTTPLASAGMGRLMDVMVSMDSNSDTVTYKAGDHPYKTKIGLTDGAAYNVEDLRYASILANGEDAADALSDLNDDTLQRMNDKAVKIGMTATTYTNTYGYEDGETSTAYDIALLAREFVRNENLKIYYSADRYTPTSFDNNQQLNRTLMSYDGIIGGYETASDQAKTVAAVSAERNGMSLTAAVMGAADKDTAEKELTLLLNYGFDHYKNVTIQKENVADETLDLTRGNTQYHITFSLKTDINVLMAADSDESSLSTSVEYENKDDPDAVNAYLVVKQDGREAGKMKLDKTVKKEKVTKKAGIGFFDGFAIFLAVLFTGLYLLKHLTLAIKPKE